MSRNLWSAVFALCVIVSTSASVDARTWTQGQDWNLLRDGIAMAEGGDTLACVGDPINEGEVLFPKGKTLTLRTIDGTAPSLLIGRVTVSDSLVIDRMRHQGSVLVTASARLWCSNYLNTRQSTSVNSVNEIIGGPFEYGRVTYEHCKIEIPIWAHENAVLLIRDTVILTDDEAITALTLEWSTAQILESDIGSGEHAPAIRQVFSTLQMEDVTVHSSSNGIDSEISNLELNRVTIECQGAALNLTMGSQVSVLDCSLAGGVGVYLADSSMQVILSTILAETKGIQFTGENYVVLNGNHLEAVYGYECYDTRTKILIGEFGNSFAVADVRDPDSNNCEISLYRFP
ncbi:MAG: hypothetical protein HYZ08_03215 [Candidatus Kerfeldbacteria bacterium]|nr:hypothetical protein [Candidatus Kerfeldbacteria bacterium]